ncbi:carbohydrate-binding module family 18 protein [Stipitochalara longipes BDJ]|nr:carbohydrate-binding module family 18 protein [Stipitochalara longipes BDJ]
MKTQFFLALSALQAVMANTLFTDLIITDVDQGPGACIRMPQYTTNSTAPVTDLTSPNIACGYNGTFGVSRVCKVEQGGVLSFKFQQYPDNSRAGVLNSNQKGPCSVYMKYVDSAIGDAGAGNGWFKIYEEGYDKNSSQWCTDTLIQDNGLLSVTVPTELAGGYYLVRPELMTLQQGDGTPSFYIGCAQIFLDSGAATLPKDVVSIPGYIQAGDSTLQFDISAPELPYTVPGPKVYVSNISLTIQHPSLPFQNAGMLPSNAVLTNANWFGLELSPYSTAEGCSNATASCYNQSTACLSMAGPIGISNCNIWINKCETMESNCNSGNYNGPPNQGKILNPTPSSALYANTHAASLQPSIVELTTIIETPSTHPSASSAISASAPSAAASLADSSAYSPPPGTKASPDGTCGPEKGYTCLGNQDGPCCSSNGYCGATDDYCGKMYCQPLWGHCDDTASGVKLLRHRHRHLSHDYWGKRA